jgi:hypothetical protein
MPPLTYSSSEEAFISSARDLTVNQKKTYFFHGFAGTQIAGDPSFFDLSASRNDGAFGTNLTNATAWGNPGYVTTVNPAVGALDSVIRLPNLNLDYLGGEKLILWWLGKVTPEAAGTYMMGDGGIATTVPGVRIRINTDGTTQLSAITAGSTGFTSLSPVIGDGTLHCFGYCLDGATRKYGMWTDTVMAPFLGGTYTTFNAGAAMDLRNSNTFQIGTSSPKAAGSSDGIATQTRAFAMLKLGADEPMPSPAELTNIFRALRRDPGKLILDSAF